MYNQRLLHALTVRGRSCRGLNVIKFSNVFCMNISSIFSQEKVATKQPPKKENSSPPNQVIALIKARSSSSDQ
jgi:hypothetical protein